MVGGHIDGHVSGLLVYRDSGHFESLQRILRGLTVETCSVRTCKEAREIIPLYKPHVIFTESTLADGSWASILDMAESAEAPINVIVVGSHPNTQHYLSVMERGAYDFIAPPFEHDSLNFILRSAVLNARYRRENSSPVAVDS